MNNDDYAAMPQLLQRGFDAHVSAWLPANARDLPPAERHWLAYAARASLLADAVAVFEAANGRKPDWPPLLPLLDTDPEGSVYIAPEPPAGGTGLLKMEGTEDVN